MPDKITNTFCLMVSFKKKSFGSEISIKTIHKICENYILNQFFLTRCKKKRFIMVFDLRPYILKKTSSVITAR